MRRFRSLSKLVYDSQSGQYIDMDPVPRVFMRGPRRPLGGDVQDAVWRRVASTDDIASFNGYGVAFEANDRDALSLADAARARGLAQHVVLSNKDDLLAAELADREVGSLVVAADESLVDLLCQLDVEGLPMRQRLAVRVADAATLGFAVEFGITQFTTDDFLDELVRAHDRLHVHFIDN